MTIEEINALRPGRSRLVLDTSPLVVLVVGIIDARQIPRYAGSDYSENHYRALRYLWDVYSKKPARVVTTSHVLTESLSRLNKMYGRHRTQAREILRNLIADADEPRSESTVLMDSPHYLKLGLTDAAIWEVADERTLVVTADFDLAGVLAQRKAAVQPFRFLTLG